MQIVLWLADTLNHVVEGKADANADALGELAPPRQSAVLTAAALRRTSTSLSQACRLRLEKRAFSERAVPRSWVVWADAGSDVGGRGGGAPIFLAHPGLIVRQRTCVERQRGRESTATPCYETSPNPCQSNITLS